MTSNRLRRRHAGTDLGAAITALRRGDPVLIRDDKLNVLALAAELVTEAGLRWLREVSAAPPRVVLTRRRAVALGLAPRRDLSGALTISVSPEMPAAVIRNLADPGASLGAEPPGFGPEPVIAKSGGLAAVTLAKLASLLPAALVVRVGAAEAALLARRGDIVAIEAAAVFKRHAEDAGLTRVAEARVPLADAENARLDRIPPGRRRGRAFGDRDRHTGPVNPGLGAASFRMLYRRPVGQPALRLRRPAARRHRVDFAQTAAASYSISRKRGAASGSSISCAPIDCRTPVSTRSTPTNSWVSTPTNGSICRPRTCCGNWVLAWSVC